MRRTPLNPFQLCSNRFSNNQPTLLAMSSIRVTPGSRSVYISHNGHDEITRFVNDQYTASRIDLTRPYPTGYQVTILLPDRLTDLTKDVLGV